MGNQQYTPEFKDEAVRQVMERGYPVKEVAERRGVPSHSLYKWVRSVRPDPAEQRADELLVVKRENLKLRAELRRVEEERDILKNSWARGGSTCGRDTPAGVASFSLKVRPSADWCRREPVKKHGPGVTADLSLVTPIGRSRIGN